MGLTRSKLGVLNFDSPVIFDLETSGVDQDKHDIIQIAALHPETKEEFEVKLKFDLSSASQKALAANCFDPDVWEEEAVSQMVGLKRFCEFLGGHKNLERISKRGNGYKVVAMMGWRIDRFDIPFLLKSFERFDIWAPFDLRVYDIMQWAMLLCPGLDDYTMGGMAERCGVVPIGEYHDAMVDVKVCAELAGTFIRCIYDDPPKWAD